MRIAFVSGLSDKKLRQKLRPLQELSDVDTIDLYRRKPYYDEKVQWQRLPLWATNSPLLGDALRLLYLLLRAWKYDLIVGCHQKYHGVMAWLSGKLWNKPVVQMVISQVGWVLNNRWYRAAVMASAGCAVRGEVSLRELRHAGYDRSIEIIANPYNPPKEVQIARDNKKIYDLICVAGLAEQKGHAWLLDELAIVKRKLPNIKVALVGAGPLRESLEKKAEALGLQVNIHFLGWLDEPELQKAYASSCALVLTSSREGLPMCVVEAMSLGLPVIVTGLGEVPWLVQDGVHGRVISYNESASLAKAIEEIVNSPDLASKMGRDGRSRILELAEGWSLPAISAAWQRLIDSIV